ncbi:MAG: hypothetical protein QY310_11930 [Candidatus Jettenia sp. CY-1]|nr:MAG: hypothetical protein QY310_11930 [Candidatus Jettenia sp. CY-1]
MVEKEVDGLFYSINLLVLFVCMVAFFLLAFEGSFRFGHLIRTKVDETAKSWISTIDAAILGILALLLGFTFSMSLSRFDLRKQLVIEEANAIGTTYLRAQLLPEPYMTEISDLLHHYVDVRLEGTQPGKLHDAIIKSEQLQNQLWLRAVDISKKASSSMIIVLFLNSLNEMIDLHAKRLAAFENRVPQTVLILLFICGTITVLVTGYGCGLGSRRNFVPAAMMSLILAMIILVIMDLDRPQHGFIRVSQQSLIRLQQSLNPDSVFPTASGAK